MSVHPFPCPTCTGSSRETVGMVCQTCGTDYGRPLVPAGRMCCWCSAEAVAFTSRGWLACQPHADEDDARDQAVLHSAERLAAVEGEITAERDALREHIRQEFAVVVTALLAGRIDGQQAVASLAAIHEREATQ